MINSHKFPIVLAIFGLLILGAVSGEPASQTSLAGDPIAGGRIYDNWMAALDLKTPGGDHPLWANQDNNTRSGDVTWRCKECHGWDYKGAQGSYGPLSFRYTGFDGLENTIGKSQDEVLAWLDGRNNPDHDFLSITNPNAMNDLAVFLRTMQVDVALFIDYETGLALGNEKHGRSLYLEYCAECHANSGKEINFSAAGSPLYVADIAFVDPWQALHKIRFGTSTESMPSVEFEGLSLREIANVLAYSQSLLRGNPNYEISQKVPNELSTTRQGEIEPIILGAFLILSIIATGLIWEIVKIRDKSS